MNEEEGSERCPESLKTQDMRLRVKRKYNFSLSNSKFPDLFIVILEESL